MRFTDTHAHIFNEYLSVFCHIQQKRLIPIGYIFHINTFVDFIYVAYILCIKYMTALLYIKRCKYSICKNIL